MKKLVVSPEELYFLGKWLQGKYIDYSYLSVMKDVQQQSALCDAACREKLAKNGIIKEDFWGEPTVPDSVRSLLKPLFFGKRESQILVLSEQNEKEAAGRELRLHWADGNGCMTILRSEGIEICEVSRESLSALVIALMPEGYHSRPAPEDQEIALGEIERVIVLKNRMLPSAATINVYYIRSGWICEKVDADCWKVLSPREFYDAALHILKGDE